MELKTYLWHEIRYTYRDAYVEYLIKQNVDLKEKSLDKPLKSAVLGYGI